MNLQETLIDGIEFLRSLPYSEENETRIAHWNEQLNTVNMQAGTVPTCPTGYYWNGTACVKDVG